MPDDVSRETPPTGSAALFGEAWPQAERYAELLSSTGVERGLLGPRETPRLWSRHLLNCLAITPGLATGASVCDVGSGAGLPGIVVALARPDLDVTLLEPLLRRVTFLREAAGVLELRNLRVVRGRAEDYGGDRFDAVTARAVAPLERLAAWCLPLCRDGGTLLAMKGANAEDELRACAPALQRLGARSWQVRTFDLSTAGAQAVAVEVVAGETGAAVSAHEGA